jgi:hypothetical protein
LTFFMVAIQLLRFTSDGGSVPPPAAWPPGGASQPVGLGLTARRSRGAVQHTARQLCRAVGQRCRSTAYSQGSDAGELYSIRVSRVLPFATFSFDSALRWR